MHKLLVSRLQAKDIMTSPVITMTPATTLEEAVDILLKNKVSGAPVVDANSKILLSVASEFDLMKLLAQVHMSQTIKAHLEKLPPTQKIVTASPEEAYSEVFKKFLTNDIRRILVVDERRCVLGVIARRDVIRSILEEERKGK